MHGQSWMMMSLMQCWIGLVNMVYPVKRPQINQPKPPEKVKTRICPLFNETYVQFLPEVKNEIKRFRDIKKENPMQKFGKHDTPFKGILGQSVPGLWHAHIINNDISIVYRIHGKNPTIIDMYGFFTHKVLGTGNHPDVGVQRNMAKQFKIGRAHV